MRALYLTLSPAIALFVAVLWLVVNDARRVSGATLEHVTARAYGCDFPKTKSVSVQAFNRHIWGDAGRSMRVPAAVASDGALQFEFDLPAGAFAVSYNADGQECWSGGEGLVILAGHYRHILISMKPGEWVRDWHNRKFYAGTLPAVGLAVSVVTSDSWNCPTDKSPEYAATIDDGAYYVGFASGLHSFLKLRLAFDTLYIALPDSPKDPNDEVVIRDISLDDLRKLITSHNLSSARPMHRLTTSIAIRIVPRSHRDRRPTSTTYDREPRVSMVD